MKQEEIRQLFQQFEQVACVSGEVECWSARKLCAILCGVKDGYWVVAKR